MHEPTFVGTLVTDNDGNVGGSFGGHIEARGVQGQIVVKIPANPDVTELERSGDPAA
jgi:hypothetical protein